MKFIKAVFFSKDIWVFSVLYGFTVLLLGGWVFIIAKLLSHQNVF